MLKAEVEIKREKMGHRYTKAEKAYREKSYQYEKCRISMIQYKLLQKVMMGTYPIAEHRCGAHLSQWLFENVVGKDPLSWG